MPFPGRRLFTLAALTPLAALLFTPLAAPAAEGPVRLDYLRDVRPILADNCLRCHGNDPTHREAELRLDQWDEGPGFRGASAVIASGNAAGSELMHRITDEDPEARMPPPSTGKQLKPDQVATLERWIAEGAEYRPQWSFVAPVRPDVPDVAGLSDADQIRNPIDAFVLARLEAEGLGFSPRADRAQLLRRLSLDLTGLPPTVAEVHAFAGDDDDGAYERAVERLLASPHFGERWARPWLDAARYADSDGFEKDKPRSVWMYRDWVIKAFNADMPYDRFVVEQIAGDMLPDATQDQRVATGFLRNSMINEEGGIDPEQFRMEAMFDRMDAVGKAVLGLTVQCAQCHTHKYDPVTHTDYYRMFAFLNDCDEAQIAAYLPEQQAQWAATEAIIASIEAELKAQHVDWPQRMAAWEAQVRGDQPLWTVVRPQLDASGDQKHSLLDDGSVLAQGYAPAQTDPTFVADVPAMEVGAVRLEVLTDPNLPCGGPGRSPAGGFALTEFRLEAAPASDLERFEAAAIKAASADVNPPQRELDPVFDDRSKKRRVTGPIDLAVDGDNLTAWTVDVGPGRSNVPRKAVFTLEKPLELAAGSRLRFRLTQRHGGWNSNDNQNNNLGRFRLSVTPDAQATADPLPADVRALVAKAPHDRTDAENARVFNYWRTTVAEFADANRRIDALWASHPRGTTQLVLRQRDVPRQSHRLDRGNFLAPAEAVEPGVPEFLHPLPPCDCGRPANRLDFARWLVDRRSPTTARAIVNRIWQAYFGTGLVATAEDLGTQGELPSHPELLDWLAVELMDHQFSVKHIHRLIVASAAYQQSSRVTPELLQQDPANRLLARGPRFRVDAETVRDIALASSGLLTRDVGGPSVYPPAPEMLFQPPNSYGQKTWSYSQGRDKYRRALYTFRFRSVPYPVMQAFDAPTGEFACVRRARSNTPLQALTTLNEPLFLECARALARKALCEAEPDLGARLTFLFESCVARPPTPRELRTLAEFYGRQLQRFEAEGADVAAKLGGDAAAPDDLPRGVTAGELAAWTAAARVVLNLDETITKE